VGNAVIKSSRSLRAAAKILRYEDSAVTIQVTSNDDGILVFTDSYYPGWQAYVDGKPTTILKTNHFFRGVPVAQGTHMVEFKYDPQSFKLGLLLSLFTFFCILQISGFVYVQKSRAANQNLKGT
jgi:uncharacterized membrane protein YfhO